jgi:hypothetical protein
MTWVLTHPRNLVSRSATDGLFAIARELDLGSELLTRVYAWNLNWPYFVPHARDYGPLRPAPAHSG